MTPKLNRRRGMEQRSFDVAPLRSKGRVLGEQSLDRDVSQR